MRHRFRSDVAITHSSSRCFLPAGLQLNVWPKTADFRFVLDQISVLASPDGMMATVIAPWTSTGYDPDGSTFARPGRATMVFSRNGNGWLCVHSHMSLNRGVPQASHANRPVKAW